MRKNKANAKLTEQRVEKLLKKCKIVDEFGVKKDFQHVKDELCFGCHSY